MSSYIPSPYKTPTKRTENSNMSLSEIMSPTKSVVDGEHEQVLEQIKETKNEISFLSAKTDAYTKNTNMTYESYSTPVKKDQNDQSYRKSPYGKQLGISDYSPYA